MVSKPTKWVENVASRCLTLGWAEKGLYWSTGSMLDFVTWVTEGSWKNNKNNNKNMCSSLSTFLHAANNNGLPENLQIHFDPMSVYDDSLEVFLIFEPKAAEISVGAMQ